MNAESVALVHEAACGDAALHLIANKFDFLLTVN
jgi:hypothetical protein